MDWSYNINCFETQKLAFSAIAPWVFCITLSMVCLCRPSKSFKRVSIACRHFWWKLWTFLANRMRNQLAMNVCNWFLKLYSLEWWNIAWCKRKNERKNRTVSCNIEILNIAFFKEICKIPIVLYDYHSFGMLFCGHSCCFEFPDVDN